jgi:Tfp pilus assembly protein PilO
MLIDNFAKLNSRTRNAISAALILIITIVLYGRLVSPHVIYLAATQEYGDVLSDMIKTSKVVKSAVEIKKKKLKELGGRFAYLQNALFSVKEAKEFFSDLQAISEQAGCAVYSLNFATGDQRSESKQFEDASGIAVQTAMLSVIGGYNDIVGLVERLKTRPQRVYIDSFKITSHSDGSGRLKCDITVKIYTIQDKEALAYE